MPNTTFFRATLALPPARSTVLSRLLTQAMRDWCVFELNLVHVVCHVVAGRRTSSHRLGLLGSGERCEQRRLPVSEGGRLHQELVADLAQRRRRLDALAKKLTGVFAFLRTKETRDGDKRE